MLSYIQRNRYFFRELLPRMIVTTLVLVFLMPHCPGLKFQGGLLAACLNAEFYTFYFMLWGAFIMASAPVEKFLGGIKSGAALAAFHVASLVLIPLLGLLLAMAVSTSYSGAASNAWYGPLLWVIALNACCALTHDYGNRGGAAE